MQRGAALRGVDGHAHRADETDREVNPDELGAIAHHQRDALAGLDSQREESVGSALNIRQHLLPGKFRVVVFEPGLRADAAPLDGG